VAISKSEIPTPALLLDLDAFENNLKRMVAHVEGAGKVLRPHAKAHKCPEIARRQILAGAVGICVATVAEAELMAQAGIRSMLLTSPVADPLKMRRIAATGAMVTVDHEKQAEWYQDAARAEGKILNVLVDLDVGDHRTGARDARQVVAIAEVVSRSTNLRLRGIQAYSVAGSHAPPGEERVRISREVFARAVEARDAMTRKGFQTDVLSGGSTGTWQVDTLIPQLTELQAGSFVLMDLAYRKAGLDFAHAMTVLTTVVSANHSLFVTVDAGFKAFSTDRGYGPEAKSLNGTLYRWGGDEFGYVELHGNKLGLGDRVEFIPPHCDPTVNLYDRIYACRGDSVEGVWGVKRLPSESGGESRL